MRSATISAALWSSSTCSATPPTTSRGSPTGCSERPLITRRGFTAGLLLAAATRSARAQAPATQHRIVLVFAAGPRATRRENQIWQRFFSELRRSGYVEGNNLVVEVLSAGGHFERHADVARQAVSRSPDVIVAQGNSLVVILRSATAAIPIVAI